MITIKTNLIAAIAKWAVYNPRYSCVMFRSGRIVATDGRRIVDVPHDTGGHEWAISSRSLLASVAALMASRDDNDDSEANLCIDVAPDEDGFVINFGAGCVHVMRGEFPYKLYDNVLTSLDGAEVGKPADGVVLNPRYLADVGEVLEALGDSGHGVKVIGWSGYHDEFGRGVGGPLLMTSASGARFAIMPMVER